MAVVGIRRGARGELVSVVVVGVGRRARVVAASRLGRESVIRVAGVAYRVVFRTEAGDNHRRAVIVIVVAVGLRRAVFLGFVCQPAEVVVGVGGFNACRVGLTRLVPVEVVGVGEGGYRRRALFVFKRLHEVREVVGICRRAVLPEGFNSILQSIPQCRNSFAGHFYKL